jgi:transcriptional regulator with XRE-family HTH domain
MVSRIGNPAAVATREDAGHRGQRRATRLRLEVGNVLRDARRGAGLSQQTVARRAGTSQAGVSRTERGGRSATLDEFSVMAAVVGLDLVVRLFPGPDPVRDQAHIRLFARLQAELPAFDWQTEVPIPVPGDQRAIDAMLHLGDRRVGFELDTRLVDAQALVRRIALKQRDAALSSVVLVLADTRSNRIALSAASHTLRPTFPLGRLEVMGSLRTGRAPNENGIVLV